MGTVTIPQCKERDMPTPFESLTWYLCATHALLRSHPPFPLFHMFRRTKRHPGVGGRVVSPDTFRSYSPKRNNSQLYVRPLIEPITRSYPYPRAPSRLLRYLDAKWRLALLVGPWIEMVTTAARFQCAILQVGNQASPGEHLYLACSLLPYESLFLWRCLRTLTLY